VTGPENLLPPLPHLPLSLLPQSHDSWVNQYVTLPLLDGVLTNPERPDPLSVQGDEPGGFA